MSYKTAPRGVIRLSDGAHLKPGSEGWAAYGTWISAGNVPEPEDPPEPPQPLPTADVIAHLQGVLSDHMQAAASARAYDSIQTAALRAALPDSPFHAEGVAYGTWMDNCNAMGYTIMSECLSGTRPVPTDVELLEAMPVLVLPPPIVF